MSNFKWNEYNFVDLINIKENEVNNLPANLNISTISATCKLSQNINLSNIEKYLPLDMNDILSIEKKDVPENDKQIENIKCRTLIPELKKKKRDKKKNTMKKTGNQFYNQITLIIRINHEYDKPLVDPEIILPESSLSETLETSKTKIKKVKIKNDNNIYTINLKLFKNGSIQMAGCKSIESINIVLNKLIYLLKQEKGSREDNKINHINFIEDPLNLTVERFKITMINTNYRINTIKSTMIMDKKINLDSLYALLKKKKINCVYETCRKACVTIKYTPTEDNIENKVISIFIFSLGNIIIAGANKKNHTLFTYDFINKIIVDHYSDIYELDEDTEENINFELYNMIMKDGLI
jgi:TATA-box binding protein (TBP) (component of TFIID and TFIIIB)